jgi:hypothetical protein
MTCSSKYKSHFTLNDLISFFGGDENQRLSLLHGFARYGESYVNPATLNLERYKTREGVIDELQAISPKLVGNYDIRNIDLSYKSGVQLLRKREDGIKKGRTSIVWFIERGGRRTSNGAEEGLYEIYPRIRGKGLDLYFSWFSDQTFGHLSLRNAVQIAEMAERQDITGLIGLLERNC